MANIFINAAKAREDSRSNTAIHSEVRSIESAILFSVETGLLTAKIDTGTSMTTDQEYYNAYYGVSENRVYLDQIDVVKKYFEDLGYGVKITANALTGETLVWNISW